jgi:hypothetical protein
VHHIDLDDRLPLDVGDLAVTVVTDRGEIVTCQARSLTEPPTKIVVARDGKSVLPVQLTDFQALLEWFRRKERVIDAARDLQWEPSEQNMQKLQEAIMEHDGHGVRR